MSDKPFSPKTPAFEYPDAAGYPDGEGTLHEGVSETPVSTRNDIVQEVDRFLEE